MRGDLSREDVTTTYKRKKRIKPGFIQYLSMESFIIHYKNQL